MRLIGKAMALGYRLVGKDRYDDFRLERVHGVPFIVTPSVFNPKVPRTGEFLASQIDSRLVAARLGRPGHGHGIRRLRGVRRQARATRRGGGYQSGGGSLRRHQCAAESSGAQDRGAARRSVRGRVPTSASISFCSTRRSCAARRETTATARGARATSRSDSRPVSALT